MGLLRTLIDRDGECAESALPQESRELYDGVLHFRPSPAGRPFVIGNFVSTLDGVVSYEIKGRSGGPPGSAQGLYLVVSDVAAARKDLVARGVQVSEVFHPGTTGAQLQIDGSGRISGPAPWRSTYGSFATFRYPDGNGWLIQEITTRLPGRGLGNLDVATLTALLQETEKRHGEDEPTAPKHEWSARCAAYIVARQGGKTPEEASMDTRLDMEGGTQIAR